MTEDADVTDFIQIKFTRVWVIKIMGVENM